MMKRGMLVVLILGLGMLPGFCDEGCSMETKNMPLVKAIEAPAWLVAFEAAHLGQVIHGVEAQARFTVELALENVRHGKGGPFAAAIFDSKTDAVVAVGVNMVTPSGQSWAHAEMTAISHAQNILNRLDLKGYTLVSSCEPCAMCNGAIPWSGVDALVYAAPREMPEKIGFDEGYKGEAWRKAFEERNIRVVGPLLGDEAFAPFAFYQKNNGSIY